MVREPGDLPKPPGRGCRSFSCLRRPESSWCGVWNESIGRANSSSGDSMVRETDCSCVSRWPGAQSVRRGDADLEDLWPKPFLTFVTIQRRFPNTVHPVEVRGKLGLKRKIRSPKSEIRGCQAGPPFREGRQLA